MESGALQTVYSQRSNAVPCVCVFAASSLAGAWEAEARHVSLSYSVLGEQNEDKTQQAATAVAAVLSAAQLVGRGGCGGGGGGLVAFQSWNSRNAPAPYTIACSSPNTPAAMYWPLRALNMTGQVS